MAATTRACVDIQFSGTSTLSNRLVFEARLGRDQQHWNAARCRGTIGAAILRGSEVLQRCPRQRHTVAGCPSCDAAAVSLEPILGAFSGKADYCPPNTWNATATMSRARHNMNSLSRVASTGTTRGPMAPTRNTVYRVNNGVPNLYGNPGFRLGRHRTKVRRPGMAGRVDDRQLTVQGAGGFDHAWSYHPRSSWADHVSRRRPSLA